MISTPNNCRSDLSNGKEMPLEDDIFTLEKIEYTRKWKDIKK